jgi:heme exporter protein B
MMTRVSLLGAWWWTLRRDLMIALRRSHDVLTPLVFFVIVSSLFPLAVGPEPELLKQLAPGVVWVAALLATMVSLNRIFNQDYIDGSLEQLLLTPHPLSVLVLAKITAHWLLIGLPLLLITPILAVQWHIPTSALGVLLLSLLLATPVLSLIGAIGAALTLGVRGSGVLVSLLVLPLYTPVLIFGASGVAAAAAGQPFEAQLSILGAFLVVSITFAPWVIAAALRISLD